MSGDVLLVEDTETLSMVYSQSLIRSGLEVTCAYSLADARAALSERKLPSIMLLDLQLPDGDGMSFLKEAQAIAPDLRVIVITANGSIYRAVQAMRAGAFDFLVKPFDDARLATAVQNALSTAPAAAPRLGAEADECVGEEGFEGFIGHSPVMTDIYRMIRSIGRSTATVFITGESGTGKDLCARAIHACSTRAIKPFVPLNCAAIPRDLLESEVFGHLKGSFTGALSDKPGAAAIANGGTLFLDEICEMDLRLQTKLLRFLQTSTIQPVGASKPKQVDVRIVCATNRDPMEEVKAGRFREDLYYRLHVVPIHMPPLRERPEDVLAIARASLASCAEEEGKAFAGFDRETEDALRAHPWPGNIRQLLNVIRNVAVLHDGAVVTLEMLPSEMHSAVRRVAAETDRKVSTLHPTWTPQPQVRDAEAPVLETMVGQPMAKVERAFIEATIRHCNGSIPRAAGLLELSPSTIYRKIDAWNSIEKSA